jgi:hypothetical protein
VFGQKEGGQASNGAKEGVGTDVAIVAGLGKVKMKKGHVVEVSSFSTRLSRQEQRMLPLDAADLLSFVLPFLPSSHVLPCVPTFT